jgi:hypothetical protein
MTSLFPGRYCTERVLLFVPSLTQYMQLWQAGGCGLWSPLSPVLSNGLEDDSLLLIGVQAQQYAALRKPYLINDIVECSTLMDRRSVYRRLQACTRSLPLIQSLMFTVACRHALVLFLSYNP